MPVLFHKLTNIADCENRLLLPSVFGTVRHLSHERFNLQDFPFFDFEYFADDDGKRLAGDGDHLDFTSVRGLNFIDRPSVIKHEGPESDAPLLIHHRIAALINLRNIGEDLVIDLISGSHREA
jgi:hypothetical protein